MSARSTNTSRAKDRNRRSRAQSRSPRNTIPLAIRIASAVGKGNGKGKDKDKGNGKGKDNGKDKGLPMCKNRAHGPECQGSRRFCKLIFVGSLASCAQRTRRNRESDDVLELGDAAPEPEFEPQPDP